MTEKQEMVSEVAGMKRWEYLQQYDIGIDAMDELGAFGWELVGAVNGDGARSSTILYFKRRLRKEVPGRSI